MLRKNAYPSFVRKFLAVGMCLFLVVACGEGTETEPEAADDGEPTADDQDDAFPELGVTLTLQTLHPDPEHRTSRALLRFVEAVEERSNGEITFEVEVGGAIVPVTEADQGLESGLLDMAFVVPIYSPDALPLSNLLADLAFLHDSTPVLGTLQGAAAYMEYGLTDEQWDEFRAQGVQPLGGLGLLDHGYHLFCRDGPVTSTSEADGNRARVAGDVYASHAEAIGLTSVNIPIPEVYEALERGVIDCQVGSLTDTTDLGLTEIVDNWTIGSEVTFPGFVSTILGISTSTWDSLPVEAQQLLWDTAGEVYVKEGLQAYFTDTARSLRIGTEAGVEFHDWDASVVEAWGEFRETTLDEARPAAGAFSDDGEAYIDGLVESHEVWKQRLEDMGYGDAEHGNNWNEFAERYPDGDVDIDAFIDVVVEEILATRRPQ